MWMWWLAVKVQPVLRFERCHVERVYTWDRQEQCADALFYTLIVIDSSWRRINRGLLGVGKIKFCCFTGGTPCTATRVRYRVQAPNLDSRAGSGSIQTVMQRNGAHPHVQSSSSRRTGQERARYRVERLQQRLSVTRFGSEPLVAIGKACQKRRCFQGGLGS